MKKIVLFLTSLLSFTAIYSQNEDPAGSIALTPVKISDNATFTPTSCGSTVYNLGASTSTPTPAATSGTMSNDVWFHFVAVAEVAKIKVCSPTTFDAAIEVWNSSATGASLGASNVGGSGAKEYLCVPGLIVGSTYKVRVGRVSGSGAGTFNVQYEHFGVEVRDTYYPDPPGPATCYDFVTGIQRTIINFPVGNTRWKFVDSSGNVLGPFNLSYMIFLSDITGVCEGQTYQVYCEVNATDPECGAVWWGYSAARPITVCPSICPTFNINAGAVTCGSTYCDIFTTAFNTSYIGLGFQYQWRFVTDNGSTDFCTPWSTSSIFQPNTSFAGAYQNYFRYNKIYSVYVRARKCITNPSWCGPCTITACSLPNVAVASSNCCKWRNKCCSALTVAGVNGIDQYRFRFYPVDPTAANPYIPTGPAVSTNWSPDIAIFPNNYPLTLGTVYNVQVQCRKLPFTGTNCDGSTTNIGGQQSDWGLPCLIGIRASSSPAVGSNVTPCNIVTSFMLPEDYMAGDELRFDDYVVDTFEFDENHYAVAPTLILTSITNKNIQLNLEEAALFGDGTLTIINMNGQIVHNENLTDMHTYNFLEVQPKAELPTGVYIISILSDYGVVSDKIFISNNE